MLDAPRNASPACDADTALADLADIVGTIMRETWHTPHLALVRIGCESEAVALVARDSARSRVLYDADGLQLLAFPGLPLDDVPRGVRAFVAAVAIEGCELVVDVLVRP